MTVRRYDSKKSLVRFPLGRLCATPGIMEIVSMEDLMYFLARHASGDWGDLSEQDQEANEDALKWDNRILSAYNTEDGTKIWVITEADRSVTTVLLPDEY